MPASKHPDEPPPEGNTPPAPATPEASPSAENPLETESAHEENERPPFGPLVRKYPRPLR